MKKQILVAILCASQCYGATGVFIIGGQSNAVGPGVQQEASAGDTLFANDYTVKSLTDPTDDHTDQVDMVSYDSNPQGSCWPPMCTNLTARASSENRMLVPCALSGTSIGVWVRNPADHFDRTTLYGSMAYRAVQAATNGTARCVLWWQGESDSTNGQTQVAYQTALTTLSDNFFADTGFPLMVCKLQHCTGADATGLANVQAAEVAAWGTHHVLQGPDLSDITTDDGFHIQGYTELKIVGVRWANCVVTNFYTTSSTSINVGVMTIGTGHFLQ